MNRYMKTLNEFLLGKNNQKANTEGDFYEEFCLVLPWGPLFDKIYDEWGDASVNSDAGYPTLFLLRRSVAQELLKEEYTSDYDIYEIPDRYKTLESFEEFEEGYNDGKYDNEDLKEIKYAEL